ncbi:MAG: NAD(+) diphosphatase [Alphaproteobacteria bacterium]|nr:NAD(+) diphosphatase [Alphaproteobacteria bacterium]
MSKPNFYAGAALDRVSHLRQDSAWVEAVLSNPETRLVPVWRAKNLFVEEEIPRAAFLDLAERLALIEAALETVLLGLHEETAYVALDLSHLDMPDEHPEIPNRARFRDIRAHGPLLDRQAGAVLAYARGMLTWHQRHRFCGVCGSPTESRQAGFLRVCSNPGCGHEHHPRTDPAVIMLVTHGDQCLLGRQAVWPPGMHSTLAGFVEPGESLEEAVAREVAEESGIRVTDVRYRSSQPWPFPSSIMLGFHARAETTEIRIDPDEIEDVRWFSRDFVRNHVPDDRFRTPRKDSIAWRLIEEWLAGD